MTDKQMDEFADNFFAVAAILSIIIAVTTIAIAICDLILSRFRPSKHSSQWGLSGN
jgi:hypothetical protein